MSDNVNKPKHYDFPMEPILFFEANLEHFNGFQYNVLKYVIRYQKKNGLEDLRKARFYLDRLIKIEEAKRVVKDYAKVAETMRECDHREWYFSGTGGKTKLCGTCNKRSYKSVGSGWTAWID